MDTVSALGRPPAVGHVAVNIDDDIHGRARALHVRVHPKITWAEWVEQAIAEKVERDEAARAEAERRRRSR